MDPNKCPKVVDQALGNDYADCKARAAQVKPADIIAAITDEQCESIKNNTGIYNNGNTTCDDLAGELLCDIRQDLEAVLKNEAMTIFANDFSKCDEYDTNPTLASMWSRIYRFSQAVTCVLCAYDPFIATLLKSGRFPQVLMGAVSDTMDEEEMGCSLTGYPVWANPDTYPTQNSLKPVTSGGVYQAIRDAILSVWHIWEEHPEFDYFGQAYDTGDNPLTSQTGMVEGDTALVCTDGTDYNILYTYTNGQWEVDEVLGPTAVPNFTVTHIKKGYWADKGMYVFLDDGIPTWQVMDANLTELEYRVEALEDIYSRAVLSQPQDSNLYLVTTRPTLSQAMAVPATSNKVTLTFVTPTSGV